MRINVSIVALLLLLFSSCNAKTFFYQVYDIQSKDVLLKNNRFVYEGTDCEIAYNLWDEGGNLSFMFTNKTDKNMYLIMPQSFFILNGIANDYYSESSYSYSESITASAGEMYDTSYYGYITHYWYPSTLSRWNNYSIGKTRTKTVKTKEMPYICIPPKSAKIIRGFNISDFVYKDCDNYKENYPRKTSSKINYKESNTPLSFRNRIAISYDDKGTNIQHLENSFWLEGLQNFSEKAMIKTDSVKECENTRKTPQKRFVNYAPNKYYNKYIRKKVSSEGIYESDEDAED